MTHTPSPSDERPTIPMTTIRIVAVSIDGVWSYEHSAKPGTPWIVTHVPTGHVEHFESLPQARHWTASDGVLCRIRRSMEHSTQHAFDPEARSQLIALVAVAILSA